MNAEDVEVPEGMRLVGWFCEHPLRRVADEDGYWSSKPWHRRRNHRNKRGWSEEKNTTKALHFPDPDQPICPQAVPMFIRDDA